MKILKLFTVFQIIVTPIVRAYHVPDDKRVDCTIIKIEQLMINPDEELDSELMCQTDDEYKFLYPIVGLDDKTEIIPGSTKLIGEVIFNGTTIDLSAGGDYKIIVLQQVETQNTEGERILLVLWAVPLDCENDVETSTEIANAVFGICDDSDDCIPDPGHLRGQMSACSLGKMIYNPAECDGDCAADNIIVNGVMEVPINENFVGIEKHVATGHNRNYARAILTTYGIDLNSFNIMHVIPTEIAWNGVAAFAAAPGTETAFQDRHAASVGVQMHEMGHNLGFHHSAHGYNTYGDHSCSMGSPSFGKDGPLLCYNAAKSWQSNWYVEDSVSVDVLLGQSYDGFIIGTDDYVNGRFTSGAHQVIIKIPDPNNANDYYAMFNRNEGMNNGITFFPNTVVLVNGRSTAISKTQAMLDVQNNEFSVENFGGSYHTLHVKLCEMNFVDNADEPDTARVLVYLDDNMSCAPTISPTSMPSSAPSISPSSSPTVEICEDSPLPLTDAGIRCAEVAEDLSFCDADGVPSHCPVTCNSCFEHECSDSELGWDIQGGSYTCPMLAGISQDLIDFYCEVYPDLTKTCRSTCQFCPTRSPSSVPSISLSPSVAPSGTQNIALNQTTSQSSTEYGGVSSRAVDGNIHGHYHFGLSVTATEAEPGAWWKVELEEVSAIHYIVIYNREDCCGERLDSFIITIHDGDEEVWHYQNPPGTPPYENVIDVDTESGSVFGNVVQISLPDDVAVSLSLAEVMVMGSGDPPVLPPRENVALSKPTTQSSTAFPGYSFKAVDGNPSGQFSHGSITLTEALPGSWWSVDLEDIFTIHEIVIYNRVDCCASNLDGFTVTIFLDGLEVWSYQRHPGTPPYETAIVVPGGLKGNEVKISLPENSSEPLSLAEVMIWDGPNENPPPPTLRPSSEPSFSPSSPPTGPTNVALSKPTIQSSISSNGVSSRAVDGNISGQWSEGSVTHTSSEAGAWWKVDLQEAFTIFNIIVYNRDDCCSSRLNGFTVTIFEAGVEVWSYQNPPGTPPYENIILVPNVMGDEVMVSLPQTTTEVLSLAEVLVMTPGENPYSDSPSSYPSTFPSISFGPTGPSNVALLKSTSQSSIDSVYGGDSSRAVDGNTSGQWHDGSVTATNSEPGAWWKVDLDGDFIIFEILVFNREDCCPFRLDGFVVTILDEASVEVWSYENPPGTPPYETIIPVPDIRGNEVKINLPEDSPGVLSLAEVVVMAMA